MLHVKLKPLEASLGKVLDLIESKDINEIFIEPVDLEEVSLWRFIVLSFQIMHGHFRSRTTLQL